jgi:NDP-sugar pyrophosphorylase family protein
MEKKKPVLVIMAAGMGSRYGGLKQIDPVDEQGHIIMDFSIYDAKKAGFEKVVFVIKRENEADFKEAVIDRIKGHIEVSYVFQDIDSLPEGYILPEGRNKPWGTAHAVLAVKAVVDGPFAVINADDYYGYQAFEKIYNYLTTHADDDKYRYTMVGYELQNTVTEHGYVSRGICEVNASGELIAVTERTHIEKRGEVIAFTEDEGTNWVELPKKSLVSMNMWGFTNSILDEIEKGMSVFLEDGLKANPLKCEYYLPAVVTKLLKEDRATVTVLTSSDKWYGVTYKEDKPMVVAAIKQLKDTGLYPKNLW